MLPGTVHHHGHRLPPNDDDRGSETSSSWFDGNETSDSDSDSHPDGDTHVAKLSLHASPAVPPMSMSSSSQLSSIPRREDLLAEIANFPEHERIAYLAQYDALVARLRNQEKIFIHSGVERSHDHDFDSPRGSHSREQGISRNQQRDMNSGHNSSLGHVSPAARRYADVRSSIENEVEIRDSTSLSASNVSTRSEVSAGSTSSTRADPYPSRLHLNDVEAPFASFFAQFADRFVPRSVQKSILSAYFEWSDARHQTSSRILVDYSDSHLADLDLISNPPGDRKDETSNPLSPKHVSPSSRPPIVPPLKIPSSPASVAQNTFSAPKSISTHVNGEKPRNVPITLPVPPQPSFSSVENENHVVDTGAEQQNKKASSTLYDSPSPARSSVTPTLFSPRTRAALSRAGVPDYGSDPNSDTLNSPRRNVLISPRWQNKMMEVAGSNNRLDSLLEAFKLSHLQPRLEKLNIRTVQDFAQLRDRDLLTQLGIMDPDLRMKLHFSAAKYLPAKSSETFITAEEIQAQESSRRDKEFDSMVWSYVSSASLPSIPSTPTMSRPQSSSIDSRNEDDLVSKINKQSIAPSPPATQNTSIRTALPRSNTVKPQVGSLNPELLELSVRNFLLEASTPTLSR